MADNKLLDAFDEGVAQHIVKNEEPSLLKKGLDYTGETAEDVGLGAAQGLTLGTTPMIGGALGAVAAKASGKEDRLADLYNKYQELIKERIKKSEERSPVLFKAAELSGAAAPVLLSAGTGTAALGARGLAEAGAIGAGKQVAKDLAAQALEGAAIGGISGLGSSEGKLVSGTEEQQKQVGKDVLSGAALGGLAGPILGSAAKVAGSAVEKYGPDLQDSKYLRQLKQSYEAGKQKLGFTGEQADTLRRQQAKQLTTNTTNDLLRIQEELGQNIASKVDTATQKGIKLDVDNNLINALSDVQGLIQNNELKLPSDVKSVVIESFDKLLNNELTPTEAYNLRKTISELREVKPEFNQIFKNFNEKLTSNIENKVEGFTDSLSQYHDFSRSLEALGTKGYEPRTGFNYGIEAPKVEQKIGEIVGGIGKPGTSADTERNVMDQFVTGLNQFTAKYPEISKQVGLNPKAIETNIRQGADLDAIRQVVQGYEPKSGVKENLLSSFTPRGMTYKGANAIGKFEAYIPAVDLVKTLYNAPKESISNIANRFTQSTNKNVNSFGQNLRKAIDNNDTDYINRLIFIMGQRNDLKNEIYGKGSSMMDNIKNNIQSNIPVDKPGAEE